MPEQQTEAPVVETPTEVSIDSPAVPFAGFVKARREGKTTAIPAENSATTEVQEQENSGAASDEDAAKPGTESETEPSNGKPKAKGGFQRKIDKLTTRNYELQNELERLRAQTGKSQPEQPAKPQPQVDAEPRREQFNSDADFVKAQARYEVRQELAAERQREQQRLQQEDDRKVLDGHHKRVSEALGKYDDWDEVVKGSDVIVQPGSAVYIQRLSNGPDVMYHLASHPETAEEIQSMPEIDQIGALGQLSKELKGGSETKPRKEKPESRAPEPITPVAANTKSSPKPLSEMPFMDYMKARQAGRSR
jgi:hypothetical protein